MKFAPLVVVILLSCSPGHITRIRAGQSYEERSIDARAYAAYLRGRIFEARGNTTRAVTQYETVISIDPKAAEAWVRLGSIHCLSNLTQASDSWRKAEQLDPESPQLWLARARCELKHNSYSLALRFAQLAARFEPSSAEAASLVVIALENLNRPLDGAKWLLGATAMDPTNVYLWQVMFTSKRMPLPERRYAAYQLSMIRPIDESAVPLSYSLTANANQPIRVAWNVQSELELDAALRKDDTPETRRIAILLGINPQQLVMRALSEGAYHVVLDEIEVILALDSSNISAWIMGLVAADRIRDNVRFSTLLNRVPESTVAANDTLQNALIDLVRWRAAANVQSLGSLGTSSHPEERLPESKDSEGPVSISQP